MNRRKIKAAWSGSWAADPALPASAFDFDFTAGSLPAGMTFTRASTAWYFNSSGLLVSAAANVPRFDYDPITLQLKGLLIELSLANASLWSRDLTNAVWAKTNITAALNQTGIDGVASSASAITASSANGTILQSTTNALGPRTLSAYVKRLTGTGPINVTVDGGNTWYPITVSAGWTRFVNITQVVTNAVFGFQIVNSGDSIAVDAVQLEGQGLTTSPILTTNAVVTRSGDMAILTPIAWYNSSQGTFMGQFDCGLAPTSFNNAQFQLDNGGNTDRYLLRAQSTWDCLILASSVVNYQASSVPKVPGSGPVRTAVAYGPSVSAAAAGVPSNLNDTVVANLPVGVNRFIMLNMNAWVRRVTYWNTKLTDIQLQTITTGPLPVTTVAPPIDAIGVAALGAYGFRKLRAVYAGAAMNVIRASDSATQDIGFDASGNFDTTGYNTFIGASTGSIHTWYDQSGNGYNLAVAATAPVINLTGINGKPTAIFTASNNRMQLTSGPSSSQPYTMAVVAERTGAFTAVGGTLADWNSNDGIYFFSTANQVQLYATPTGSAGVACTDGVAHSLIGLFNGASSSLTVDNATSAVTVGGGTISGLIIGGGNGNLTGYVSESIAWASALSAGNISTLAANQKSYWGTP